MIRALIVLSVAVAVYGMTTMMAPKILYDMKHHKAMIVKADGCYEYHLNHDDVVASQNAAQRPALETRMLAELAMAVNIQEMGHNHINHMSEDIKMACASVPVYSWELPQMTTMDMVTTV